MQNQSIDSKFSEVEKYIETDPSYAKGLLNNIIKSFPDEINAYLRMGDIYFEIEKNLSKAEEFYKKALEIESKSICYSMLGLVNHKKGNKEKAEEFYRYALNLKPQPKEMFELASFYLDNDRYNEAIMLLKNAKNKTLKILKHKNSETIRYFYTSYCYTLIDAYRQKGDLKSHFKEQEELDKSPYRLRPNRKIRH